MTATTATAATNATRAPSFEELAQRVDEAAVKVAALEPEARRAADELRAAVEAAHREALLTMVRRLRADEAGRAALYELVDDPLVHLLFSLHGIIRPDPLTQARAVLDTVRPQLQAHRGDAELVRVDDGTAYIRLAGACNGCSMSSVTMRDSIEQALVSGVPTIRSVEVLPSEPTPTVIPLSQVRVRSVAADELLAAGWVRATTADALPPDEVTGLTIARGDGREEAVVVVRVGASMTAYRNRCAHMAMPLDTALVDPDTGTLTCSWHGFCYDATTGECLTAPGVALNPLPLRVEGADVWIQVDG